VVEPFSPTHRILYRDYTVLSTAPDGTIEGDDDGLFDHDARILSVRRLSLDDRPPSYVACTDLAPDRREIVLLTKLPGGDAEGPHLPQDGIEVRIETRVGPGMTERITVVNRSMVSVRPGLRLELAADFTDSLDIGRRERRHRPEIGVRTVDARGLEFSLDDARGSRRVERATRITADRVPTIGVTSLPALEWHPGLGPGERWSVDIVVESLVDGRWRRPAAWGSGGSPHRRLLDEPANAATPRLTVESEPPLLGRIVDRAIEDLLALRNRDLTGDGAASWVPNAGVPRYTGVFGRDVLTAGWQAALMGPEMMHGALRMLAGHQAIDDDAFRDAEPGKLPHEMRRGPLSELDITPHRTYFGTQTAPALFVLALSELWHWTGDTDALRTFREPALRALAWAAEYGDRDGDGFLETLSRSADGLQNQGWKDSNEAIRYPDGRNVSPPLATVEEQAFHALALERMAEILWALEDDEAADQFLAHAADLRRRWHDAYWLPEDGFYAMALDADKRRVASIGSNAGHALGAGIVPIDIAEQVADRLLEADLFSGWGVRTLSSGHRSYNPFAYHLGTVWPVEQATFALGMKRYGLDDHARRLIEGVLAAAADFRDLRLPELLSGLGRDESTRPVPYPDSNSPQAWSASATIQLAQLLAGLYPFAPFGLLAIVRPTLPAGTESLTLRNVRVGRATVSIRFDRTGDGTAGHTVLAQDGHLIVVEAPPPQAIRPAGAFDAVKAWAIDHVPGRQARALRIALGLERDPS
jgi:glycogen debranching enzyme